MSDTERRDACALALPPEPFQENPLLRVVLTDRTLGLTVTVPGRRDNPTEVRVECGPLQIGGRLLPEVCFNFHGVFQVRARLGGRKVGLGLVQRRGFNVKHAEAFHGVLPLR